MCSLCFGTVYDGEHWTDEQGQKWDSHQWCSLLDKAAVFRRNADIRRRELGVMAVEDEEAQEREFFRKSYLETPPPR
jgi:hypothetical protein